MQKNKYDSISTLEMISDIIPAISSIKKDINGNYIVLLRNGHIKILKTINKLHLYLGWLLFHDSLIK